MRTKILILILLFCVVNIYGQLKNIQGVVTDVDGNPLPGVTVMVKGTTNGTITDIEGNYIINEVPQNATLIFSFVGMQTKEIASANQNVLNIVLEEEAIGLDEVVAIGYGVQRKINLEELMLENSKLGQLQM